MNNKGSMIVEMSLIAPILVGVMFMAINMIILAMNKGIVTGAVYSEIYIAEGETDGDDIESGIRQQTMYDITDCIKFADNINADVSVSDQGMDAGFMTGTKELVVTAKYDQKLNGSSMVLEKSSQRQDLAAGKEIRDTGSNLRRWQIYGKLLSD